MKMEVLPLTASRKPNQNEIESSLVAVTAATQS
jgi:hypothetical protein